MEAPRPFYWQPTFPLPLIAAFGSKRASLVALAGRIAMALASPRHSSAASASRGASQPAEEDRDTPAAVPARGAPQPASFTVASFNFGFEQGMMSGKKFSTHCSNFGRVCATIVQDADADLLFACFSDGASQPAVVSLHGDTDIYHVPIGQQMDAVITRFDVQTSGHGKVHVVIGNMHIVCGERPLSILTRQRAVRFLRVHLDGLEAPESDTPVVRLAVGDNNLTSQEAREAFQRHADDEALWEVFASPANRTGVNVAVCGAVARFRPVRNDAHDAVAVVVSLPGASQPAVPELAATWPDVPGGGAA